MLPGISSRWPVSITTLSPTSTSSAANATEARPNRGWRTTWPTWARPDRVEPQYQARGGRLGPPRVELRAETDEQHRGADQQHHQIEAAPDQGMQERGHVAGSREAARTPGSPQDRFPAGTAYPKALARALRRDEVSNEMFVSNSETRQNETTAARARPSRNSILFQWPGR